MLQRYDERNQDLIINIGGELLHRERAGISPFDSLVQGGGWGLGRVEALRRKDLPSRGTSGQAHLICKSDGLSERFY